MWPTPTDPIRHCSPKSARPPSASAPIRRNGRSSVSSKGPAVNNFLGQLNLTAQERRIVVIIFLVVIVVLNLLFVWPRFGDWGSINKQLHDMYGTIDKFNRVIAQDLDPTNGWKKDVAKLARQEGGIVLEGLVDPQVK